jgi:hypothetical protein
MWTLEPGIWGLKTRLFSAGKSLALLEAGPSKEVDGNGGAVAHSSIGCLRDCIGNLAQQP